MANEKERLLIEKGRCQQSILDAIIKFEESTGLDVGDIEYHKTDTPICFGDNACSKETMTQKWVTIVISL